ncbi:MAG: YfcE family phosphodiesterase [Spirochaetota bacterium]|jgi:putative phosphoesterase
MKIGLISDTHNDIELVQKAIAIFKERNISVIIHAGDLTSSKIISLFKGFDGRFVLGNCDIDVEEINTTASECGFGCVEHSCQFTLDGKNFMVFHGNNVPMFREAVNSGKYDYIIKGHTHIFENYVSGKTRIINPGSLYRGEEHTVAILDTETDKVEKIRIDIEE